MKISKMLIREGTFETYQVPTKWAERLTVVKENGFLLFKDSNMFIFKFDIFMLHMDNISPEGALASKPEEVDIMDWMISLNSDKEFKEIKKSIRNIYKESKHFHWLRKKTSEDLFVGNPERCKYGPEQNEYECLCIKCPWAERPDCVMCVSHRGYLALQGYDNFIVYVEDPEEKNILFKMEATEPKTEGELKTIIDVILQE